MPLELEGENASLIEASTAMLPQPQVTKCEMSPWTTPLRPRVSRAPPNVCEPLAPKNMVSLFGELVQT